MFIRFWTITLSVVLVALYLISRDRKVEFEVELKVKPRAEADD